MQSSLRDSVQPAGTRTDNRPKRPCTTSSLCLDTHPRCQGSALRESGNAPKIFAPVARRLITFVRRTGHPARCQILTLNHVTDRHRLNSGLPWSGPVAEFGCTFPACDAIGRVGSAQSSLYNLQVSYIRTAKFILQCLA